MEKAGILNNSHDQFSELIVQLGKISALTFAHLDDPDLMQIIETIQGLGDRIAIFFSRIQKLIRSGTGAKDFQFVNDYFFKNFSRISENTKASKHIIVYSLKRPDWLKAHADRIIESLKLLYSDLLTMQIDCQELYKSMFSKDLHYDFGLNFHREKESLDTIISIETAYRILDLSEGAAREQVKAAFRNLAKKLHPDLNPGADRQQFIRLELAYKKLLSRVH